MLAIDRLAESLHGIKTRLLPQDRVFAVEPLKRIQERVESIARQFASVQSKPQVDRICAALLKLRKEGSKALTRMDCYALCWGLTERCGNFLPLIEDPVLFSQFLDLLWQRPPSILAWRGLLDAYFRHDPDTPAGEKLRVWLKENSDSLWARTRPAVREVLDWLKVLRDNPPLLSKNPCRFYAEQALNDNDCKQIERLKALVHEGSWFWPKLILSQIEIASRWQDEKFKRMLQFLIEQLQKHETVADEGLKALLIRYQRCQDRAPHELLKDFAVTQWGSPQLHRQVKWALVPEEVKVMVSQWLVLEDLEDFFLRLQADDRADQRRLDFWRRFLRQISYSRIVLGSSLWSSHDMDWREFLEKKRERVSRLDGGGGSKNAFIMKIGRYYFVEFSETGDACYGYAENRTPFSFESKSFRYPADLKNSKRVFWGRHADGHERWEEKFLEELSNLGIYPDP